jgi:hypothetical protein
VGKSEPGPSGGAPEGPGAGAGTRPLRVLPGVDDGTQPEDPPGPATLWCSAAAAAEEPCLAVDVAGVLLAVSESAAQLLAGTHPEMLVGRPLLHCPIELVSFAAEREPLNPAEGDRLPPLVAARTRQLARGLLRVVVSGPAGEPAVRTIDAVSAPLVDDDRVVGSLTFLALV